jgi:hypothetical protein
LSRDTLEPHKVDFKEENDRLHNFSLVVIPANVEDHSRPGSLSLTENPACHGVDPSGIQIVEDLLNEESQPIADTEFGAGEFPGRRGSGEEEPYVFKADNLVTAKNQGSAGPGEITKRKRGRPPLTSGNPKAFKKARKKIPDCFEGFQPQWILTINC